MRTFEEIVAFVEANDSMFGFAAEVLIDYLPYKHARDLLTDKAKEKYDSGEKRWDSEPEDGYKPHKYYPLDPAAKYGSPVPLKREIVLEAMESYWRFGIEKLVDERGLSVMRAVEKMKAYLWLLDIDPEVEGISSLDDVGIYFGWSHLGHGAEAEAK